MKTVRELAPIFASLIVLISLTELNAQSGFHLIKKTVIGGDGSKLTDGFHKIKG